MSDSVNTPLAENEHVKELLGVLQENQMDSKNLVAMLGYVAAVEKQLDKAAGELAAMRKELSAMREERNHPVRTALTRAIHTLENGISAMRARLDSVKAAIVTGCKDAVAAFKANGRAALNNLARFFRLKPFFQAWSNDLDKLMKASDRAVAKIEAVSAEYHAAGRHVKNVARVLSGREPVAEIKPNGRLAHLMEAPFKVVRRMRAGVKGSIDRAAAALGRLEKDAPVRERKPSVLENIKKYKEVAAEQAVKAPVRERKQGEAVL